MNSESENESLTFDAIVDLFFTPVTVLIGLIGNSISIVVLRKKDIQLRDGFARILIALAVFDFTFILSSACIFTLPALSSTYRDFVYPHIVPFFLPLAQIAMTASVYTTVITCFDRYIAICRPALLGCCGRSEQKTSWCLITGTGIFSVVYNITRFFEYKVVLKAIPETNMTTLEVIQTPFRQDPAYIQWYILIANFVFMGLFPSTVMIIFNVLVVRAVNEANKKRARMTKRQQRNITVTSMLVSVVVFFLICHSVKFIVTLYEIYCAMMSSNEPWPSWVDFLTKVSHWLLILNSSSNIVIYLHKDPRFKAVFKKILFSYVKSLKSLCFPAKLSKRLRRNEALRNLEDPPQKLTRLDKNKGQEEEEDEEEKDEEEVSEQRKKSQKNCV